MRIRIWKPSEVPGLSAASLKQLMQVDPSGWSAATVCVGDKHVIITNDRHSDERQNNSLMHELSHVVLKHKPAQVFVSNTGQMMLNVYDKTQEEEAICLSGALLVPRDALLHLLSEGHNQTQAAAHFAVTIELLKMRVNRTGVGKQLASRRARSA